MNQDELLQKYLLELENGKPLRQILADLPGEERELGRLLSLAAHTREVVHPQLNPLKAKSQRGRVTLAVRSSRRVTATARRPAWGLISLGAAVLAVFAFLTLGTLTGLAFLITTAQSARAATIMDVSGIVEASPGNGSGSWIILKNGDSVHQGTRLRTLTSSSATLVFYDGSRTTLGDRADITLDRVGGGWNLLFGRALQVRFEQTAGLSHHSVVPLKGESSFFEVLTPSGKATVHGTVFDVDVNILGNARFSVSRGVVEVSQSDTMVTLTAGQATLSEPNSAPLSPDYEFSIQGKISAIAGDQWTVNGITFTVLPSATGEYTFQTGDWVSVRGRFLADGSYVADRVNVPSQESNDQHFSGVVESIGPDTWTISSKKVAVDENTEVGKHIGVGDPVEVTFTVKEDGSWLAKEIDRAEDDHEEEPTRTPTAGTALTPTEETETPSAEGTATPSSLPTPSISPTTATPEGPQTQETTPTPEGNRAGCETSDRQHPEGLRLAQRWGVPYPEIMSWFCKGFGFGEIDLAYELAQKYGKPVSEVFALKSGGMGWGNIRKQLEHENQAAPQPQPTRGPKQKQGGGGNGNGNGNGKSGK
jgi:hypothetical protein